MTLSLSGGQRSAPIRVRFVRDGDSFVSEQALPDSPDLPVILRVVPTAGAAPVFVRFVLDRGMCGGCNRMEYACACDHSGHDH
jgi:hypothetical protein